MSTIVYTNGTELLHDWELERRFFDELSSIHGDVDICGIAYDAAYVLERIDQTAYRCRFVDWLDREGWVEAD